MIWLVAALVSAALGVAVMQLWFDRAIRRDYPTWVFLLVLVLILGITISLCLLSASPLYVS